MKNNFKEVLNEKTVKTTNNDNKGRKLIAKESTFTLDEGEYKGKITDSFWYKTAEERDRVMLVFELEDGTIFKNSVDGEWIEDYPFSRLISQADISFVSDFVGLKVVFTVRNSEGNEVVFSNIRKISLLDE